MEKLTADLNYGKTKDMQIWQKHKQLFDYMMLSEEKSRRQTKDFHKIIAKSLTYDDMVSANNQRSYKCICAIIEKTEGNNETMSFVVKQKKKSREQKLAGAEWKETAKNHTGIFLTKSV